MLLSRYLYRINRDPEVFRENSEAVKLAASRQFSIKTLKLTPLAMIYFNAKYIYWPKALPIIFAEQK